VPTPETDVDDFIAFADVENMWFGPFDRKDVFRVIRCETEDGLRRQVSDTVLERIETVGRPMFLVFGKETSDPSKRAVATTASKDASSPFVPGWQHD